MGVVSFRDVVSKHQLGKDFLQAKRQEALRALHFLNEEHQNGRSPQKPKRKGGQKRWIKPIAENFRRTQKGNDLINQELLKLLQEQGRLFARKAMLTVDKTHCHYKDSATGTVEIVKLEKLFFLAPKWFSAFYSGIRNKLHYGCKVQESLASVLWLKKDMFDLEFGFLILDFVVWILEFYGILTSNFGAVNLGCFTWVCEFWNLDLGFGFCFFGVAMLLPWGLKWLPQLIWKAGGTYKWVL